MDLFYAGYDPRSSKHYYCSHQAVELLERLRQVFVDHGIEKNFMEFTGVVTRVLGPLEIEAPRSPAVGLVLPREREEFDAGSTTFVG